MTAKVWSSKNEGGKNTTRIISTQWQKTSSLSITTLQQRMRTDFLKDNHWQEVKFCSVCFPQQEIYIHLKFFQSKSSRVIFPLLILPINYLETPHKQNSPYFYHQQPAKITDGFLSKYVMIFVLHDALPLPQYEQFKLLPQKEWKPTFAQHAKEFTFGQ